MSNKMRLIGLALCVLSLCLFNGCAGDPIEDVSSVPEGNRAALQACFAAPDLPGNHWPAGAGKARCWLSMLPQNPSLRDIEATLKEPDGALKLERRYADILAAHYKDPVHRDLLFLAFKDFRTPEGERVAKDWIAKSSGSAFAHIAMGDAAIKEAWKARGNKFVADTTGAQFDGMTAQLKIAVPLLLSALRDEPRLSPACVDLMEIANMVGDANLRESAANHCAKVDPLSWHVNN
jgi:hypothetical protein